MLTCFSSTFLPVSKAANCSESNLEMPLLIQETCQSIDFEAATELIIIKICETTDWDYAEIWVPTDNSTFLELSSVWHISSYTTDFTSLEQFRLCSEGFVLSPGEGLPGRVWSSAQSEWIANATASSESYWLRNQIAKAFDISAGFGVPIVENYLVKHTFYERVLAVLVFFKLETQTSTVIPNDSRHRIHIGANGVFGVNVQN
jgi:hypothetical protein